MMRELVGSRECSMYETAGFEQYMCNSQVGKDAA